MRFFGIIYFSGPVFLGFLVSMLLPFILNLFLSHSEGIGFAWGSVFCLIGFLISRVAGFFLSDKSISFNYRDIFCAAAVFWFLGAILGAFPIWYEIKGISWVDAFFEATSAVTTTGSTIFTSLEKIPKPLLFWRHILQWVGGVSSILMAGFVLPLVSTGGTEFLGALKDRKFIPRDKRSIIFVLAIYVVLTFLCFFSLCVAGLNFFDALCHAFSIVSLGGFSTHNENIAYFHSFFVEAVVEVFLIFSSINFYTHLLAIKNRSIKPYLWDIEIVSTGVFLLFSILLLGWCLHLWGGYSSIVDAFRYVTFSIISVGTSAGFTLENYTVWTTFIPFWILFLGCILSSTGTSGGGIKMMRLLVLIKQTLRELQRLVRPRAIRPLTLMGNLVEESAILSILGFMLLWGATHIFFTLLFLSFGHDFVSAFSVIVATLNNIGSGLGSFSSLSSFSTLTDLEKLVLSVGMVIGRVEFSAFFLLFLSFFWKK